MVQQLYAKFVDVFSKEKMIAVWIYQNNVSHIYVLFMQ